MDAAAQLALMAKATNVFSDDDTFLSFPITPLSYKKAQLDLLEDTTFANIIEFSMITNMIPDGTAWEPNTESFLWDVYKSILKEGTFAESSRTDDEESRYRAARNLLNVTNPDGTISESLQHMLYHHYQSLYEKAMQAYSTQLSTALQFTDADEIKKWHDVTEPKLREDLSSAQHDWVSQGYRYEVESAQATVEALGAKSPGLTWADWSRSFDPDIDSLNRAVDQNAVFPTSYVPASALDESSWQTFEITEAELAKLLSDAPVEIRSRLNPGNGGTSIESMAFEFSTAKLVRPWFRSEAFRARFWRFNDGRILSDGSEPPSGICPAYPVAVVFARKIKIRQKPTPTNSEPDREQFDGFCAHVGGRILYKNLNNQNLRRDVGRRVEVEPGNTMSLPTRHLAEPVRSILRPSIPQGISRISLMHKAEPIIAPLIATSPIKPALLEIAKASTNRPCIELATAKMINVRGGLQVNRTANVVLLRQALASVDLPGMAQNHHVGSLQNPPNVPAEDDSIFILAFVCKPVPHCPDPDESLQW